MKRTGHTILLGGVGGDSHSVGLTILRQSLVQNGYRVCYLGTQNCLEDFFRLAARANVVMISSMDGHVHYYLRDFVELMKRYEAHATRWFLGGNLHIGPATGFARQFLEIGFSRVFEKFVDINTVLQVLERELAEVEPIAEHLTLTEDAATPGFHLPSTVSDEMMEVGSFNEQRRVVIGQWPTGTAARDLSANAEFLARQPSFPEVQMRAQSGSSAILLQPRSGVAGVAEQIKLFQAFKSVGVPVLSYQVDSLTRNNNYPGVVEALRESRMAGTSTLNGFPIVNHGVEALRRIISEVKVPIQTRHSTRDPRLLAEISYAGGVTAFEGGAICYNIPYYKDYALDRSIRIWQYVDRLTGFYYERFGIKLDREFFGTLTATLIPPSLAIVVNVVEALLAVQQGVKCVSLGYAEQGNRIQDVAAIRMLSRMTGEVLSYLGYRDIQVNTVFHQYMAAFPSAPQRAGDLVYNSAITAALSGATRVIVKTAVEAVRIPTLADNLHALGLVMRAVADVAQGQVIVDEARVTEESAIIRREVRAILDSLIYCGDGSVATGIVNAFRRGFLDIPFAPSLHNKGAVVTARDKDGAIRFLSFGNLQFDQELRDFHREKMQERRRLAGGGTELQDYLLVEKDVLQIARNEHERWPLAV
jgi:methylaspartate mutase epsilon subunit